jgi:hypothetical protein
MGKIYTGDGWILKVQGDEHPPLHVHLLHPDGKASIALNGEVQNTGVPDNAIAIASAWIAQNTVMIEAEWAKMNNPKKR